MVLAIYNSLSPRDTWKIVNIGKSNNQVFNWPSYPSIPWSYGYTYDSVPQILEEDGVIEAKVANSWFMGVENGTKQFLDAITIAARQKKYITDDEIVNFYCKYSHSRKSNDRGPTSVGGQYSILVNIQKLIAFYQKYNQEATPPKPIFNEKVRTLDFLGEKILFKGKIEQKSVKILVDNMNSMVSKKDFFDVRGEGKYEVEVKKFGSTPAHEPIEKVFKEIKSKITSNDKLKKVLILAQQEGFGMFIDQKAVVALQKTE